MGEEDGSNAVEAWGPASERKYWKIFSETFSEAHRVYATIPSTKTLYAIGGTCMDTASGEREESMVERFRLDKPGCEWVACASVPTISVYCEHGVAAVPAKK